jgi:hypothetical protein
MSEKLLDDVCNAALFGIRARQPRQAKKVIWFRIRPDGPRDVSAEEIAETLDLRVKYVEDVENAYLNEVGEMAQLLFDFVDRADRVLEFRRLVKLIDQAIMSRRKNESRGGWCFVRNEVTTFFSGRGRALLDEVTVSELMEEMGRLREVDEENDSETQVETYEALVNRLRVLLTLVTPQPLPKR